MLIFLLISYCLSRDQWADAGSLHSGRLPRESSPATWHLAPGHARRRQKLDFHSFAVKHMVFYICLYLV